MRSLIALLLALAASSTFAADNVRDHAFTDAAGRVRTPASFVRPGAERVLILFWADWCAPCKDELRLVASRADTLREITIVAISVDADADAPASRAFLASINWPFAALEDREGTFFYTYQPSGELPLALCYDREGFLAEAFGKVDEAALERVRAGESRGARLRWRDSFVYVERRNASGASKARAIGHTTSLSYGGAGWDASLSHDALRQKRPGMNAFSRWEDELGATHVELHDRDWRVRAGDAPVLRANGLLFAARTKPESNEASTVTGLHAAGSRGGFSLDAFGGQIRDRLYQEALDPTTDASTTTPFESVRGAGLGYGTELWSAKMQHAHYERGSDGRLGFPTSYADDRVSAEAKVTLAPVGLEVAHATIRPEGGDEDVTTGRAVVTGSFPVGTSLWLVPVRFAQTRGLAPRTVIPSELPDLFVPLDAERRRTIAASPQWIGDAGRWSTALSHAQERSLADDDDRQQTTTFVEAEQRDWNAKAGAGEQKNDEVRESVAKAESAFGPHAHGTLLHRTQRSDGAQTSARFDAMYWHLTAGIAYTHQTKRYLDTSGIDDEDLTAYHLGAKILEAARLTLAYGKEPGGVKCTGGVCAVRPPLDGVRLTGSLSLAF